MACVVQGKMWRNFFVTPTPTTRRQKWSLYVASAKAGRRHNKNTGIQNITDKPEVKKRSWLKYKLKYQNKFGKIRMNIPEWKWNKISKIRKQKQKVRIENKNCSSDVPPYISIVLTIVNIKYMQECHSKSQNRLAKHLTSTANHYYLYINWLLNIICKSKLCKQCVTILCKLMNREWNNSVDTWTVW